jgi:alkaline phosphatase
VILYIGDGFGLAPKTAARMAMGQGQDGKRFTSDPDFRILALDNLKYNATVTTHSLNSWVTDSGPGRVGVRLRQERQAGQRGHLPGPFHGLSH